MMGIRSFVHDAKVTERATAAMGATAAGPILHVYTDAEKTGFRDRAQRFKATLESDHACADVTAFVGEHSHAHAPSTIEWSKQLIGGKLNIGEEHLVELCFARDLFQTADLNARQVHGKEKERDALVLFGIGIGARHENAPIAVTPSAAPHLLPIDDEPIAVAFGLGGQSAEVAARTGLAEQLALHSLGSQRGKQVLLLLLGSSELHDRTAGENETHHVEYRRNSGEGAFVHPHGLMVDAESLPTVFDGPMDTREAGSEDTLLPFDARLNQIGRTNGPVVARCRGFVRQKPLLDRRSKVIYFDQCQR